MSSGVDTVNLDTGAAIALVAEGSTTRAALKAFVQGKSMIMCRTAMIEFENAVSKYGGATEQARAARLLNRMTIVPDNPSPRVMALRPTRSIRTPDKIIFGTGEMLSATTATCDGRFIRSAAAQGIGLAAALFRQFRLRGQ